MITNWKSSSVRALAALLLVVSAACAQSSDPKRFLAVTKWTGTFTVSTVFSGKVDAFNTWDVSQKSTGTIVFTPEPNVPGSWIGTVTSNISWNDDLSVGDASIPCKLSWSNHLTTTKTAVGHLRVFGGTFATFADPSELEADLPTTVTGACPPLPPFGDIMLWYLESNFPLPATGFHLQGSQSYPPIVVLPVGAGLNPPADATKVTWDFQGVTEDLEVVVSSDEYETWRPQAGLDEKSPGNGITFQAKLQNKDGSAPTVKATRFVFDLTNRSTVPGILMNYPLRELAASDPDLQFDPVINADLIVSGPFGKTAKTRDGQYLTASAPVTAFDWGAYGTVKVTAEFSDGRAPIVGYLKGDPSQTDVRIPKRSKDSAIADNWKAQNGVMDRPDTDDSETDPVGLPGCDGDGFTMYEEYRGFMENGQRVEGNPKRKDLFILNLTGAEGEPGIWAFSELTGLAIHKDLTPDEIKVDNKKPGSPGLRIMNENFDPPKHRVAQHAVVLLYCAGAQGGVTFVEKDATGLHARPGTTLGICMEKIQEQSTFTVPGLGTTRTTLDPAVQFDKSVTHELTHAVGVDHHGENDPTLYFEVLFPNDLRNTLGIPVFLGKNNALFKLLDENTGVDQAAADLANVLGQLEQAKQDLQNGTYSKDSPTRAFLQRCVDNPQYLANFESRSGMAGLPGGQHSGDDGCVQRYDFAKFYPAIGVDNTYYMVPVGTEPIGLGLCISPQGTGVNDPNRKPQPRYFDAAPGRGACSTWVCVNDAVPGGKL